HDRVQYDPARSPGFQHVADGLGYLAAGHHADLYCVDGHVIEQSFELETDKLYRGWMYAAYALGVLSGQRGNDAGRIGTQCRKGLEVGLNAGTAAGIGARDGEHIGNEAALSHGVFSQVRMRTRGRNAKPVCGGVGKRHAAAGRVRNLAGAVMVPGRAGAGAMAGCDLGQYLGQLGEHWLGALCAPLSTPPLVPGLAPRARQSRALVPSLWRVESAALLDAGNR